MELHISLSAEELFRIGPLSVTNSMVTMFLVMAIVLLVFTFVARRASDVPTRGQSIIEVMLEFIIGLVEGTAGKQMGRRLLPLISGIFIFILFSNFSGLIPGMGTIGKWEEHAEEEDGTTEHTEDEADHSDEAEIADTAVNGSAGDDHGTAEAAAASEDDHADESGEAVAATDDHGDDEEHEKVLVPFLRAPTADLNMTLALSLLTFTMVQVYGIRAHGVGGRIKHMADPPFLFPIELISELSRILSLAARLFGNVFAGEVLLGVMYAMGAAIKIAVAPFLFPVIFLGLEVMFGTIQALVFALLTTIYITLAAAGHADHDDDHSHAEGEHGNDGHGHAATAGTAGD
jgi:F-type H+-transporting ATPase subunit a